MRPGDLLHTLWTAFGPVEWAAAILGLISVWLTVREHLWLWPTGIVSVILYIWVFFQARLYASAVLQVVFIVFQVYGWHEWLHGGPNRTRLVVERTPWRQLVLLTGLGLALGLLLGYFFDQTAPWLKAHPEAWGGAGRLFGFYEPEAQPYWDWLISAYSLVAQWLLNKKFWENWLFWIGVDLVAVPVYASQRLYPSAALYVVFLGMAIAGWFEWRKSLKSPQPA